MSDPDPRRTDADARVEDIVRAVIAVLDNRPDPPTRSFFQRLGPSTAWIVKNVTGLLALGALILIGAGLLLRGINPLTVPDTLVEKYRQTQQRHDLVDEHVALGNDLLNVGQPAAAKHEFRAALKLDESNADASLGEFKASLFQPIGRGDSDPAVNERRLLRLVETHPHDAHALAYYGGALTAGGQYEEAIAAYEKALELDPENATAVLGKGGVRDLQNRKHEALALYQQAEALSPNTQVFINNVAYQLFRLRRYRQAIGKYEHLLGLDERFLLSYYVLSQAQRIVGDLGSAEETQRRLLRLLDSPKVSGLARNTGSWFFHTTSAGGRTQDETLFFNRLDQRRFYARLSLALTLQAAGKPRGARMQVRLARRIGLGHGDRDAILRIIRSDIRLLASSKKRWATTLNRFRDRLPEMLD